MPWKTVALVLSLVPAIAVAQTQSAIDEAPEQGPSAGFHTKIYGYVDGYMEKSGAQPAGVDADGGIDRQKQPVDFQVRNLNLMVQSSYGEHLRSFVNIKAIGDDLLEVRNAWVDGCIAGGALCLRLGKMYRPFGLYNEILDAVPSYIGVEPPELFDSDHLMVTRTTNFMLHGSLTFGSNAVNYAVTTGVDERRFDQLPIGLDLNFEAGTAFKIGSSFYTTNGQAAPRRLVGEGEPIGGVLPWMLFDKYYVVGAYAQYTANDLIVQAEFWTSPHRGQRDPEQVLLLTDAGLNQRQAERFGLDGAAPTAGDVRTAANFTVKTFYTRVGYSIPVFTEGELVPYLQYDYYKNPEEINSGDFGGDNEAGLADDGLFHKATGGVVFRPVPVAALKVDGSLHFQKFNGVNTSYPEIHVSLSYNWSLFSM